MRNVVFKCTLSDTAFNLLVSQGLSYAMLFLCSIRYHRTYETLDSTAPRNSSLLSTANTVNDKLQDPSTLLYLQLSGKKWTKLFSFMSKSTRGIFE